MTDMTHKSGGGGGGGTKMLKVGEGRCFPVYQMLLSRNLRFHDSMGSLFAVHVLSSRRASRHFYFKVIFIFYNK